MSEFVHLPVYGQLKEHISFSELRLFNECNWKWLNLKIWGSKVPEEKSFQMDYGKAVHSGMEVLYGDGEPDPLAAAEHALKLYDISLAGYDGALHPTDMKEAVRLRDLLPMIFRDALLCPDLQGIRPLKSELQLYEPISRTDGLSLKFKGFIDIIFVKKLKTKSVIYIADFKTCQWGWPASKFREIDVISQILLYKHFFCKITGADPKNVSAAFILLKKKPKLLSAKGEEPKVYDLSVSVEKIGSGPKAMQAAIDYMQTSITAMHSGRYEKNFNSCKRSWIDSETKEQRTAQCPFLGTDDCTAPVD